MLKKFTHILLLSMCFVTIVVAQESGSKLLNEDSVPKPFKLAMIQMKVLGGEKSTNMNHALDLIAQAAKMGADLALLPECMDLGWTHPSSLNHAEAIPDGSPCKMLMEAAKQHKIYICAGLTELSGSDVYNSAVLISNKGELLGKHRKLNEVIIGHEFYAQGNDLHVIETGLGNFGLMICSDGFAKDQVLSRSLCYMGADFILSPSAWAVNADHNNIENPYGAFWRNNYSPVARDFSVPIIGVSNVGWISDGPWKGHKCIGSSLAIDGNGEDIVQCPYGVDAEFIIIIDLIRSQRPARGNGWYHYWKEKEEAD